MYALRFDFDTSMHFALCSSLHATHPKLLAPYLRLRIPLFFVIHLAKSGIQYPSIWRP